MAYQPEGDNNGVISPGLYATPMRNLTENKGLLTGKGMLYAGTGTNKEFVCGTNEDGTDKKITVPVTTAISPSGADEGSVLIKDSSKTGGWKVDKIGKDNIKSEDSYRVGGITSSGSIVIDPVTNDYTFRINNVVGGFTVYDDQGMAWLNADGSEGGFLNMPRTFTGGFSAGAGQTIATEEKVKEQLENGEIVAKYAVNAVDVSKIGYRHFFHYQFRLPGSGDGPQPSVILFEIINESKNRLVDNAYIQRDVTSLWKTARGIVTNGYLLTQTAINLNGDTLAANSLYSIIGIELNVRGEPYMIVFNNNPQIGEDGDVHFVQLSQLTKTNEICNETIISFGMS